MGVCVCVHELPIVNTTFTKLLVLGRHQLGCTWLVLPSCLSGLFSLAEIWIKSVPPKASYVGGMVPNWWRYFERLWKVLEAGPS